MHVSAKSEVCKVVEYVQAEQNMEDQHCDRETAV